MRANMLIVKSIKQIKLTFEKAIALCFMNGLEACSTGYKLCENSYQIDIEEVFPGIWIYFLSKSEKNVAAKIFFQKAK